jgi:hypothetical protein
MGEEYSGAWANFWRVYASNLQSIWWGIEHWLLTKVLRKEFCKSCSGYFHAGTVGTFQGNELCERCTEAAGAYWNDSHEL